MLKLTVYHKFALTVCDYSSVDPRYTSRSLHAVRK